MKILKIPLSAGNLKQKKGLEKGPDAVAGEVKNFFLKESEVLPFLDVEDVKINNSNIEEANRQIAKAVSGLDMPAILLGGDHSMTYSAFRAFSKKYSNPGLLVFDAHLDCENDFSPPTHEDYLRVLIGEGHLKKENAVVIGVRNMHTNELEFAKKSKLKIFSMPEIYQEGRHVVADSFMSVARKFDALYISVDVDVLDPAFAPGTGYTEPGGLTTRELIYFIQRLKNLKNIQMWDLVEVNPDKDINNITVMAAAKLVVEMS
ncbi:TPA: arginase family protein [Candidatus Woesearchaeota archaeon]|nr:Arginase [archaeon GW2011_AR15]MBS3104115.1 arginase family protein [Candidatus Woesearchaeota archaeon]HIH41395.1 arginase family protein [Candidatus Woesearchaeota archaeon]